MKCTAQSSMMFTLIFLFQDLSPEITNTGDRDVRFASLSVTAGALLNQVCVCVCIPVANFHVVNFRVKKISQKRTGNEKFLTAKFPPHACGMEEYERACCIQSYHHYKVLTALLTKAFVHDILHCVNCLQGDRLRWQIC